ncbi:MAG: TlpA family protein disulfide reductase, partial [Luteibaculum sp.]
RFNSNTQHFQMKSFFLGLVALIISLPCLAAFTTIKGSAGNSYLNKPVFIYGLDDAISDRKVFLGEAKVDAEGNFKLEINFEGILAAEISINRIIGRVYLKSGNTYSLYFPDLPNDQIKSFGGTNEVDVTLYDLPDSDPNLQIGEFNLALEAFYLQRINSAFTTEYRRDLLAFWKEYSSKYAAYDFVGNYIHFACANALLNGGLNPEKVHELFLDSAAYNTRNPEFGIFIKEFFPNIFQEIDRFSENPEIKLTVNVAPRAYRILEELKKNDFLEDLKLRELVALHGIQETYNLEEYNRENLLEICEQLRVRSIYEDVRKVATNVAHELTYLKPGKPLPDVDFGSYDNKKVNTSEFRGKPTLYLFWAPWSQVALNELVNLQNMQSTWGDRLNLVLVAVGENKEMGEKALDLVPNLNATKLNYFENPRVIDQLGISSIPHFMLCDEEGKIIKHYSSSLDELLSTIKREVQAKG